MAAGSANRIYHSTITTASTAETVTLNYAYKTLQIVNRGTAEIYARTDGTAPTVGGAECWVATGGQTVLIPNTGTGASTQVELISATAPTAYSVIGN